jgi:hypothetical protein
VFGQGETNSQIRFSAAGFPAIEQLVRFANESLSLRSRIRNPSRGRGAFEGEVNGLCSTFLWELTARFQISVLRPTAVNLPEPAMSLNLERFLSRPVLCD